MVMRRLLHRMDYRYRLHRKDLPGKPDIVFGARRKVIFVNGCFWQGHSCSRGSRLPKTNVRYWRIILPHNVECHSEQPEKLTTDRWAVLTLWECELVNGNAVERCLRDFLGETVIP